MKKFLTLILIIVSLCTYNYADMLNYTVSCYDYELKNISKNEFDVFMTNSDGRGLQIGYPDLPYKIYRYVLPPDTEVDDIKIQFSSEEMLGEDIFIRPKTDIFPLKEMTAKEMEDYSNWLNGKVKVNYTKEEYLPSDEDCILKGNYRIFPVVNFYYSPFVYNPVTGELLFRASASITITFHHKNEVKQKIIRREVGNAIDAFRNDVDNPEVLDGYSMYKDRDKVDYYTYLIVVPEHTAGVDTLLQNFIDWKQATGETVKIIDFKNDCSDSAYNLREYLKANYLNWNSKYLLILSRQFNPVNDPISQTPGEIPMLMCYPWDWYISDSPWYWPYPSDYYYADLTGDWNSDGDSYYGELNSGDDGIDLEADLYVGRIPYDPVNDSATVQDILSRSITYELDTSSYKDNMLLVGTILYFENQNGYPYERIDGACVAEWMISDYLQGSPLRMYECEGLDTTCPTHYSCDICTNKSNLISEWNSGNYGLVAWFAHGSDTGAYRTYWLFDDGDGVPECYFGYCEFSQPELMTTPDASSLNKDVILFHGSCLNGYPETNNLGKIILSKSSVGTLPSTRVSFGGNYTGDPALQYHFFREMVVNNCRTAEALYKAKFNNAYDIGEANLLSFNLYGEPALYFRGIDPDNLFLIDITPASGANTGTISVLIKGRGFQSNPVIKLKGDENINATNIIVSDSSTVTCDFDITDCTIGNYNLFFRNPDSQETELDQTFEIFSPVPKISSVSPDYGYNNEKVTIVIKGRYFMEGIVAMLERKNKPPIAGENLKFISRQRITCDFNLQGVTPDGEYEKSHILVTNIDHKSTRKLNCFQVLNAPVVILSVRPSVITNDEFAIINFTGKGFQSGMKVKLVRQGGPQISGERVNVVGESNASAIFNVVGRELGFWSLYAEDRDGAIDILENCIEIISPDLHNVLIYPNPAGEKVSFEKIPPGTVIKIYSINGAIIYETVVPSGTNKIEWELKNVKGNAIASGVYVCVFEYKDNRETRKIMVIR